MNHLLFESIGLEDLSAFELDLINRLAILLQTGREIFGAFDDKNLVTLKFRMLQHIAEDLQRFGNVGYLDQFLGEHFSFVMKMYLKMSPLRKGSTFKEEVQAMNSSRGSH